MTIRSAPVVSIALVVNAPGPTPVVCAIKLKAIAIQSPPLNLGRVARC
jgi:hypothetical protein